MTSMTLKTTLAASAALALAAVVVPALAADKPAAAKAAPARSGPATAGGAVISDQPKGVPNMTGKWINATPMVTLKTSSGAAPPLTAMGKTEYEQHKKDKVAGKDPIDACLIQGEPRILFTKYPFLIMQYGKHVDFLHQANHTFRITYFGEKLDPDADPIWLGHSTAKWDGKTLVIDGGNYNAETWLDYSGLPHGEKLKTEERFNLSADGATINGTVKITDPDFYTQPWTANFTLKKQPGYSLEQFSCMADHKM
ncbi:MAG TPA: hypothetical protein VGM25_04000 [Caulobacteraceae bacterium]|jgi:hypothetical protein